MKKVNLLCMFCGGRLRNASFSKSELFSYLTCVLCQKRQMCFKDDFEKEVYGHTEQDLNQWMGK